ncbi:CRAL TRIO domain-containing protein [Suillus paluster]|uniref:CRAL TRIO domain-containing protein n=1 Tax=Suillus paluster TaxID=48578 RepID=UPI001B871FBE|nr:CRAL TRIO domain-containing protein [Suillus paluster]KAG1729621.1 CRAL TRIO domain-containing protein [Suillus paluster]
MPIYVPLPVPAHLHEAAPPSALAEKQQILYDRVLEHFSAADYTLRDIDQEKAALTVEEKFWLSYECLLRYLRATNWDTNAAIKRLEDTLKWRRDFGIYDKITAEHVEPEATIGKGFIFGYDTHGRPAAYVSPSKMSVEESPRTAQYIIWMLERSIDLMGPGVETLAILADYADNTGNPSFGLVRTVLDIIQTHYPERLGLALVAHLPWFLNAFFKLIMPFMDSFTRQKLVFNPVINENGVFRTVADTEAWSAGSATSRVFEPEQLIQEGWNGSQQFVYSHAMYWEALVKLCEERRSRMVAMWHRIGGEVGTKEWDVKVAIREDNADTQKDVDEVLMENDQL